MTPDDARAVLRRGRARSASRDRARHRCARASTELFVEGAEHARRPDEEPAAQHERLQRRVALQFRLPERRQDERRHLVAARCVRPRRRHRLRCARREDRRRAAARARGVRGRFLDARTGEPRRRRSRSARSVVVVACGSLHTPILLRKSGLGTSHVGRHLTLHPGVPRRRALRRARRRLGRRDAERLLRSLRRRGLTLVGVYTAPNVLAAAFPGVGREHRRARASRCRTSRSSARMIHDDGGGQVRRWLSREPLVTYRMSAARQAPPLARHRASSASSRSPPARARCCCRSSAPTRSRRRQRARRSRRAKPPTREGRVHVVPSARLGEDERRRRERGVVKPTGETLATSTTSSSPTAASCPRASA